MTLYDIGKFSQLGLPQVRTVGLMQFDPIWAQRMHRNEIAEILFICKGRLNLIFEHNSFDAKVGDVLLIPQGTLHRDDFDIDKGVEILFCRYMWPLSEEYFKIVPAERVNQTPLLCRNELAEIFSHIINDLHGGTESDMLITRTRILTILLTIMREIITPNLQEDHQNILHIRRRKILRQAMDYLNLNYAECISLDDVADAIDISPYYLSHIFSEESGLSLFTYLTNMRMEKASEFLKSGKMNVTQVSYKVGYENANYFSKVFRKHFNCSPSKFASMHG